MLVIKRMHGCLNNSTRPLNRSHANIVFIIARFYCKCGFELDWNCLIGLAIVNYLQYNGQ